MKSPLSTPTPFSQGTRASETMSSQLPAEQQSFIVKHRRLQQGLLARAALYANNASKTPLALGQFNGVSMAKRDPIVWGDASNRYSHRRPEPEINNNEPRGAYRDDPSVTTVDVINSMSQETAISLGLKRCEVKMSSELMFSNTENQRCSYENDSPNEIAPKSCGLVACNEFCLKNDEKESEEAAISSNTPQTHPRALSFDTTQQLRSGFFRSIKRQYSPLLPAKDSVNNASSSGGSSNGDTDSSSGQLNVDLQSDNNAGDEANSGYNSMSRLARQKLEQLRKKGPKSVDVPTGLQWIRLELHEMREQDKSLFLQLIKLHSTIKDLRLDITGAGEFDSYDDLHSASSLWWPRKGYNINALPDFSSSDGAHLFRGGKAKSPLRRGYSMNYPPIASPRYSPRDSIHDGSQPSSTDSSHISIDFNTATAV